MSKCLAQGIVDSKYEINATCYCKSNYKYHEYYKRVSMRSHGNMKLEELIFSGSLKVVGIS